MTLCGFIFAAAQIETNAGRLRDLFVYLITHETVKSPLDLWEDPLLVPHFCADKMRDERRRLQLQGVNVAEDFVSIEAKRQALYDVKILLLSYGKTLSEFGLPELPDDDHATEDARHRAPYMVPDVKKDQFRAQYQAMLQQANDEQKALIELLVSHMHASVDPTQPRPPRDLPGSVFMLQASAGCGKSFCMGALICKALAEGWIALPVASTGIAALNLRSGTTAHSCLRLPFDMDDKSTCNIKKNTICVKHISLSLYSFRRNKK